MKGVVFLGNRKLELQDFPDPSPGAGEVVVAMKASGMCGSDLHIYRATGSQNALGFAVSAPAIAGHEPCGVVAEVGPGVNPRFAQSRRAGHGAPLLRLWSVSALPHGMVANVHRRLDRLRRHTSWRTCAVHEDAGEHAGAAARRALIRDRRGDLVRYRNGVRRVAPHRSFRPGYDCDFRAGAGRLVGDTIRGGDGCARHRVGYKSERLALAKRFGADVTINAGDDPLSAIKDLTHGRGADLTLDTSGRPEGRLLAVRAARAWGTACFVGEGSNVTIDVSPDMLRKQLTIVASWTFSTVGQADCAQFVADRKIRVDDLFSDRWRLDQAEEAYKLFDTQTTGKGVFLM